MRDEELDRCIKNVIAGRAIQPETQPETPSAEDVARWLKEALALPAPKLRLQMSFSVIDGDFGALEIPPHWTMTQAARDYIWHETQEWGQVSIRIEHVAGVESVETEIVDGRDLQ